MELLVRRGEGNIRPGRGWVPTGVMGWKEAFRGVLSR